ncbi:MAG: hypothetical protein K2X98_05290 [Alphaproteobacteria bacterium]|nr:hypothetical protein [Alphaproteobacteria bacterium]
MKKISATLATLLLMTPTLCKAEHTDMAPVTNKDIFPDKVDTVLVKNKGVERTVRKGVAKSILHNCYYYTKIHALPVSKERDERLKQLDTTIKGLVEDCYAVGMFDSIPLINWLADEKDSGKILAAAYVVELIPEARTPAVEKRLAELHHDNEALLTEAKPLTPTLVLPDGVDQDTRKNERTVRKGSIKAFLDNVTKFTNVSEKKEAAMEEQKEALRTVMREQIKDLEAIDFFDQLGLAIFKADLSNEGLREVARLYAEIYPKKAIK